MKPTKCLVLGLFTICSVGIASAQDFTDDASDTAYNTDFISGDNGGTGFSAWAVSFLSIDGLISTDAAEATTYSGSALLNTSSRCWVMEAAPDTGTGLGFVMSRAWTGTFPSASTGKIFWDMQAISTEMSNVDNIGCYLQDGSSTLTGVIASNASNWIVGGAHDTGIPCTSPVRVEYTYQSTTIYDVIVTDLTGVVATYSQAGLTHTTSGTPDSFNFRVSTSSSTPQTAHLLFNQLIVDPDGSLPVELDMFSVE